MPLPVEPGADLGELGAAADHPRGEVRYGGVAVPGEPLGQVEGGLEPLARRGGDGDGRGRGGTCVEDLVLGEAVGSTS